MQETNHRAVFEQYYKLVYTIVAGHLRSVARHEDIEECVSDVFAEVFCLLDGQFEGEIKTCIRMVANRRAIDRFRHFAPQSGRQVSLEESGDIPDTASAAEDAERHALQRLLFDCVKALGEPDTTILLQKYWFGASSAQIAKGVGLTPSAVRKRANKALGRLRAMLKEQGIEEGSL